jgi:hypothetical protein
MAVSALRQVCQCSAVVTAVADDSCRSLSAPSVAVSVLQPVCQCVAVVTAVAVLRFCKSSSALTMAVSALRQVCQCSAVVRCRKLSLPLWLMTAAGQSQHQPWR